MITGMHQDLEDVDHQKNYDNIPLNSAFHDCGIPICGGFRFCDDIRGMKPAAGDGDTRILIHSP